jgi:hypothetical protein
MTQPQLLPIYIDERITHELHDTPAPLTHAALEAIFGRTYNHRLGTPSWMRQLTILEPCVGNHAIERVITQCGGIVFTNDISLSHSADTHLDATLPAAWQSFPPVDWVITNPPFSKASQIIPLAYNHASAGVAMLLRLSWIEPCADRAKFLHAHPPTSTIIVNPRPAYIPGSKSTDSVTSAWIIWRKDGKRMQPYHFLTNWISPQSADTLL